MTTPTSGRTLILVRHAKAEQVDGKPDHDRELTHRGRGDARAIGTWLAKESQTGVLGLALCSTSERTRQTLEAVCAGGVSVKETRFEKRIYDASAATLLDVLREVPDSVGAVLVIGHAPGIPVLATALAREDVESTGARSTDAAERLSHGFPTSALAVLAFEGSWATLAPETAYLSDFVVARG